MNQCPAVVKHQQRNKGATDLEWLEQHIKSCKHCQGIMRQVEFDLKQAAHQDGMLDDNADLN